MKDLGIHGMESYKRILIVYLQTEPILLVRLLGFGRLFLLKLVKKKIKLKINKVTYFIHLLTSFMTQGPVHLTIKTLQSSFIAIKLCST